MSGADDVARLEDRIGRLEKARRTERLGFVLVVVGLLGFLGLGGLPWRSAVEAAEPAAAAPASLRAAEANVEPPVEAAADNIAAYFDGPAGPVRVEGRPGEAGETVFTLPAGYSPDVPLHLPPQCAQLACVIALED